VAQSARVGRLRAREDGFVKSRINQTVSYVLDQEVLGNAYLVHKSGMRVIQIVGMPFGCRLARVKKKGFTLLHEGSRISKGDFIAVIREKTTPISVVLR